MKTNKKKDELMNQLRKEASELNFVVSEEEQKMAWAKIEKELDRVMPVGTYAKGYKEALQRMDRAERRRKAMVGLVGGMCLVIGLSVVSRQLSEF